MPPFANPSCPFLATLLAGMALAWPAAAQEPAAVAAETGSPLVDHPCFAAMVPEAGIDWQPLGRSVFDRARQSGKLVFSLSALPDETAELAPRLRAALEDPAVVERLGAMETALVSPAWLWVLHQRAIFSAGNDLERTPPGMPCGRMRILLFSPDAEITGFQMPGFQDYQPRELGNFLEIYQARHERSPTVSGYYSRLARQLREASMRVGTRRARDTANPAQLAGVILVRVDSVDEVNSPGMALHALTLATQVELGSGLRQRLREGARRALDRCWQRVAADGLLGLPAQVGSDQVVSASLEIQAQLLLAEQELARQGLGDDARRERCRQLLAEVNQDFSRGDAVDSALVGRADGRWQAPCGWVELDALMLYARARLAWDEPQASLDWLERLHVCLEEAAEAESGLPPALLPAVPEDPPSVRGIGLLGLVCLDAAERSADPERRQRWVGRSQHWFERLEQCCGAGTEGYRPLPEDHPLAIAPQVVFADARVPSTIDPIGRWLGRLDALDVAAAGARRAELREGFRNWLRLRTPGEQDVLQLQVRGLDLDGGVEASSGSPVAETATGPAEPTVGAEEEDPAGR